MSGRAGLIKALAVIGIVLGVIGSITAWFLSFEGYLPGDAMVRTWATAKDRPSDDKANDSWVVGDVAVRSRFDAVTGFGIADGQDGKKLWEFVPPGRAQICGSARRADEGVLLVAYGTESGATGGGSGKPASPGKGKGCSTVLAFDMKDGRELWSVPRTVSDGRFPGDRDGFLDAAGGLALINDERTEQEARAPGDNRSLRALDLRTGKARWTAAVPGTCGVWDTFVGKEQVHAVLACGGEDADDPGADSGGDVELMAAAFDRGTGALKWNVPIDARRPVSTDSTVFIESADPLVLRVVRSSSGNSDEATGAFVAFDQDGRPRAGIELRGDYGQIDAAEVVGERMYALAWTYSKGRHYRLIAFDLKTGEEVWNEKLDEPAAGLAVRGDRITVLCEWSTQASAITELLVYDAGNGEELDERHFREEAPSGYFFEHDGRIIVAGAAGDHAFTAFERW
ncbi:outer membrane protein assembly factor BamB family protein [Streptomyces sp. SP18CS02]|uniref:outer membrane protein assembly factor BamB family protein n=1 Tax=Streptomyces sp. SP18CS02 TaxID=3002531 RepID=UPI002E76F6D8|nr:PQQ-binding-like beta-propeller repeat protein [Streptomyces sp. SP18CS02]MEE1751317.1 PQQ-binding-like beta-propeller repeat protein [Streptomyces sp. SP18CS02]